MTQTALLNPEPEKFDIRACPIWAIPQLAELRRRISRHSEIKIISFTALKNYFDLTSGEFVIEISGEGKYYGYLFPQHMNDYRHPALFEIL